MTVAGRDEKIQSVKRGWPAINAKKSKHYNSNKQTLGLFLKNSKRTRNILGSAKQWLVLHHPPTDIN